MSLTQTSTLSGIVLLTILAAVPAQEPPVEPGAAKTREDPGDVKNRGQETDVAPGTIKPRNPPPPPLPEGVSRLLGLRDGDNTLDGLAVSADLSLLAVDYRGRTRGAGYRRYTRFWDIKMGKWLPQTVQAGGQYAVGPGDKLLVSADPADGLAVWEVATGKLLRTLRPAADFRAPDAALVLALSPDGKVVGLAEGLANCPSGNDPLSTPSITFWDVATGKELKDRRITGAKGEWFSHLSFSPDGKWLVTVTYRNNREIPGSNERNHGGGAVHLFDAASGRLVRSLKGDNDVGVMDAWVSADGRTLATLFTGPDDQILLEHSAANRFYPGCQRYGHVDGRRARLWELASGKEVLDLKLSHTDAAALSQRGRLFAADDSNNGLVIWDAVTGKRVHAWKKHSSMSHAAFLDDDDTLMVLERPDVLFYDLASHLKELRRVPAPSDTALAGYWSDLASDDAARARRAVWALADSPKQGVPLLVDKLKPVPAVEEKELSRLINGLDSDKFATRQQSRAALEKLRELAEPALRKALKDKPSPEQEPVLKELLDALDKPITDKEKLRRLRAVEALEHAGTKEAQAVLKEMAKGTPAALETQSAKESLERLAKRK